MHYRGWPLPTPTKTPPTTLPQRYRNHGIKRGGESTVFSTNRILWLIDFSGQLKLNLCISSYLHSLTSSAPHTHVCYVTDLQGYRQSVQMLGLAGQYFRNKEHISYWVSWVLVWEHALEDDIFKNNSLWLTFYHLPFFFQLNKENKSSCLRIAVCWTRMGSKTLAILLHENKEIKTTQF